MQNAGRTLNRLQLIEQALGYSYDGYDRTIDAHIRDLRHKLEPDPPQPPLCGHRVRLGIQVRWSHR